MFDVTCLILQCVSLCLSDCVSCLSDCVSCLTLFPVSLTLLPVCLTVFPVSLTLFPVCLCVSLQKLAVRSCPVGTTKPLSLIKPPGQGIAISVVPAKAPVSMVTAHINGQKAASSEPLQTSPINLQTGGRVAAAGVHPFSSRRPGELPPSQVNPGTPARGAELLQ